MSSQKKNYVLPIAMMFALFFMIAFVTYLQNPFAGIVKDQFKASNAMSQLGTFANFFAYVFMGLPAGMLLKRIGYKKTALIAIAVGFVGVGITYLSGVAASFTIYLVGAFISGFSMCLLNSVVNPLLNTLGGGGKKGNQLLMFGGSINSIGATLAPVLVGYLVGANATIDKANPALWIAMGIFALAFVVLSTVAIPEPHMEAETVKEHNDKHSALSFRHFILGAVAVFVYMGIEAGVFNFINLYLTGSANEGVLSGLGMDKTAAGSITGMFMFLMMIGRIMGGAVAAKVSSKTMLAAVSVMGIVLTLSAIYLPTSIEVAMPVFNSDLSFGLTQVPIGVMLLIFIGLCTSVMWGGIFNLAVEGLGKYTSMASGIFMIMVCGGGILPIIQGAIADNYGYMTSFWIIAILFIYTLYYALVGSKNVNTDIPVE